MIIGRKGFTLLELLISLIVMALVGLLILQTYSFISRIIEKNFLVIPEKALTLMKLRYLINSTYPYVVKERNRFYFYFVGSEKELSLVSSYDFKNSTFSRSLFLYDLYQKEGKIYLRQIPLFPNKHVNPVNLVVSNLKKTGDEIPLPFSKILLNYYLGKSIWKKRIVGNIPYAVKLEVSYTGKGETEIVILVKSRDEDKPKLTKFLYMSDLD